MSDFSFETLINVLLPGFIVVLAAALLAISFAPGNTTTILVQATLSSEFSAAIVILLSSALFGTFLGSITSIFELRYFDPKSAKLLEIDSKLYEEEWDLYLDFLTESGNSYIGGKATRFFFELRSSAALLILCISFGFSVEWGAVCLVVLVLSVLLFILAGRTHYVMAYWRHRTFGSVARRRHQLKEVYGENAD